MQINPLAAHLDRIPLRPRQPSLPRAQVTPAPERNKVVTIPTRSPINKQSALLIAPVKDWTAHPLPPEKLPTPENAEIARLRNELKIERNAHAQTNDQLGKLRAELRLNKLNLQHLQTRVESLQAQCLKKDQIIRQLEDLKL